MSVVLARRSAKGGLEGASDIERRRGSARVVYPQPAVPALHFEVGAAPAQEKGGPRSEMASVRNTQSGVPPCNYFACAAGSCTCFLYNYIMHRVQSFDRNVPLLFDLNMH